MKTLNGLKPYMGYSREGGSEEGAILIFAHSVKEAKRISYPVMSGMFLDEYTDMAVSLLKKSEFLYEQVAKWSKDKLAKGEAHVVDAPPCCKQCEQWGKELNTEGICSDCEEDEQEGKE